MCTMVILRRPGHDWPVLVAANRDERNDRPWKSPGRHWPDRPEVVGGLDELAGGSWLALNDTGVIAAVLNRRGSLGPEAGKRSRGELVLEALDHADARDAVRALAELDGLAYRPFNMVMADNRDAYWLRHAGESGEVEVRPLPLGLSMLTAGDLNEPTPRVRRYLPRFQETAVPDPDASDWRAWEALMASREHNSDDARAAMAIVTDGPFGTVSSSLIALPSPERHRKPIWRFCPARPGTAPFVEIALGD